MAANGDLKRKARAEYVFQRKNQQMIATSLGVAASTIRRWKQEAKTKGDDWDVQRTAHMIAGEGLDCVITTVVEEFMMMAQSLIEELKKPDQSVEKRVSQITSLADAMVKMTNSAGKLAPKISELGVAQDVVRRLAEFVREDFPEHAPAILEILEPFGETLVEAYT